MKKAGGSHLALLVTLLGLFFVIKVEWTWWLNLLLTIIILFTTVVLFIGKPARLARIFSDVDVRLVNWSLVIVVLGLVVTTQFNVWIGAILFIIAYVLIGISLGMSANKLKK